MTANKGTARWVGMFFLFSNIVFIIGAVVFLEPTLSDPDYLNLVSTNRSQVVIGALLEILNAFAYLGIAVLMFPIFRKRYESVALAYVGLRVLEFVAQILSDLSPLVLVTVGQAFVNSGGVDPSAYPVVGEALLASRDWAFQMVGITFSTGALFFYFMLYREELVPRLFSIWGLVGAAAVLINTVFDMLAIPLPNLGVLMLLNEVILGLWLIVKGFNSPAQSETRS